MGKYLTWATFDAGSGMAPFGFLKHNLADEIRANLGLDGSLRGREIILLVYEPPANQRLLRPTVADAGLFELFRPPPTGHDDYGLTQPWPVSLLEGPLKTMRFVPIRCPEVVHEPVTLKHLRQVREMR